MMTSKQQSPIIKSMSESVFITELTEQHVDQTADVLTRSFLQLNPIWNAYRPKYQEIFPIMRGKLIPALGKGWSYVLLYDQKVIGVNLQYEFLDYLHTPSMPTDLALFAKLSKAGQELEGKLDLKGLKRGDAVYGLFGVIDPNYANRGYSLSFWWQSFARGKIAGWKYYYSRISSPVSLKMLKQLGAEVLAETTVETDKGMEKVWMIRIDLDNPLPSMSMMKAMAKNKQRSKEPRASL